MSLTTLTMTLAGTLPKYDATIFFEVICHSTVVWTAFLLFEHKLSNCFHGFPRSGFQILPEWSFNGVTFVTTWDHGTSFDQSYNQVNLDCLRDGVGVDRGGGRQYGTVFQSKFNHLFK